MTARLWQKLGRNWVAIIAAYALLLQTLAPAFATVSFERVDGFGILCITKTADGKSTDGIAHQHDNCFLRCATGLSGLPPQAVSPGRSLAQPADVTVGAIIAQIQKPAPRSPGNPRAPPLSV